MTLSALTLAVSLGWTPARPALAPPAVPDRCGEVAQAPPSAPQAATALVEAARLAAQQGDGGRAGALLERALRIAPRDAWTWHWLAVLRLQEKAWRSAAELAARSNALTGDPRLLGGNWEVIARARERLGEEEGARAARQSAERLGRQLND